MWYDKYITALGDGPLPDGLYEHISTDIMALGRGEKPYVSVVVIAYNEQSRLAACLWSLSQSASRYPVEIIVVDNASKDRTAEIIHHCGARYIYQPLQGVGHARQAGLEAAGGEFIISADADTLYPPRYIDTMVEAMCRPMTAAAVTTYWFIPDGRKSRVSLDIYSLLRDVTSRLRAIKRPELIAGGAAMVFRRIDALKVGWKTDIRRGEDGSMVMGLKQFGKIRLVLSPRVRIRSTSRTLDSDGSLWRMVTKRIGREIARLKAYFTTQKEYKDQDYNKL